MGRQTRSQNRFVIRISQIVYRLVRFRQSRTNGQLTPTTSVTLVDCPDGGVLTVGIGLSAAVTVWVVLAELTAVGGGLEYAAEVASIGSVDGEMTTRVDVTPVTVVDGLLPVVNVVAAVLGGAVVVGEHIASRLTGVPFSRWSLKLVKFTCDGLVNYK